MVIQKFRNEKVLIYIHAHIYMTPVLAQGITPSKGLLSTGTTRSLPGPNYTMASTIGFGGGNDGPSESGVYVQAAPLSAQLRY